MNFTSISMSVFSLATSCSFELGHSLQTPTLIGCMFLTYTAKSISLFANPAAISRASNYNRIFYFPSTPKVFRLFSTPTNQNHRKQQPSVQRSLALYIGFSDFCKKLLFFAAALTDQRKARRRIIARVTSHPSQTFHFSSNFSGLRLS